MKNVAVGLVPPVCMTQHKVPKRASSDVWEYFEIDLEDQKFGKCKLCNARLFRGEGTKVTTSSMKRHLKSKHAVLFEKDEGTSTSTNTTYLAPKMTQMDLKSSFLNASMWTLNDPRALVIIRKIAEMLVIDNLPYSHVEKPGFLLLMNYSHRKYKVCCSV